MLEIRVLQDRERWNALLTGFPTADLRQSHEWGEIRRRQGWTPLRLAALEDGQGVAALSVLTRRLTGIGVVAYAPRGPALAPDEERGWAALPALADAVRDATGAVFLRLSPGLPSEHSNLRQRLATAGFVELGDFWPLWNTPRNVMRLSVAASEREILAGMAHKRRQHILSTAAKKGVTTELATDLPALREFYTMMGMHGARHGYPIRDWSYFEALHAAFAPTGSLGLALGRVHGTLASALFGLRFGAVAYTLHAPSTGVPHGVPVGDAVHWTWIRWARSAGCTEIDFGSSGTHVPPRPTDTSFGIYRFKEDLGAQLLLNVGYHDRVFQPARYRLVRALERRVLPRAWRGFSRLPSGVRTALARRAA
jgi:lipid II:glycine glycyltransferase (peptidoglycan interpeptide bridge formation enzyme)